MAAHNNAETRMDKTVNSLVTDYSEIRAGRANPAVLDKVMVDYYGTPTPVAQVGTVSVAEARILVIQPWDKGMLNAVAKAIQKSDVGINPQNDGNVIRLKFPTLTEDRRKELAKDISKRSEEAKVAIRNIRRDSMDDIKKSKKAGEITEDDLKEEETALQKLTDKYIKKVESISDAKVKEILSI